MCSSDVDELNKNKIIFSTSRLIVKETYGEIVAFWHFRGEPLERAFVDIKISKLCKVSQVICMKVVLIVAANDETLDTFKLRFAGRFKTFIFSLFSNEIASFTSSSFDSFPFHRGNKAVDST